MARGTEFSRVPMDASASSVSDRARHALSGDMIVILSEPVSSTQTGTYTECSSPTPPPGECARPAFRRGGSLGSSKPNRSLPHCAGHDSFLVTTTHLCHCRRRAGSIRRCASVRSSEGLRAGCPWSAIIGPVDVFSEPRGDCQQKTHSVVVVQIEIRPTLHSCIRSSRANTRSSIAESNRPDVVENGTTVRLQWA